MAKNKGYVEDIISLDLVLAMVLFVAAVAISYKEFNKSIVIAMIIFAALNFVLNAYYLNKNIGKRLK